MQLSPLSFGEGALTLGVDDLFFRDWVDEHYGVLLGSALAQVIGQPTKVVYQKLDRHTPRAALPPAPPVNQVRALRRLNEKFTFDTYVVSDSNQLPAAAAAAVADNPGKAYNPLFIYGGTGLGKTHLLHAIGQHVVSQKKSARVTYVSSEKFTNEFIDAIQKIGRAHV